jgi:chemotaxis protein methyltransferase CheR
MTDAECIAFLQWALPQLHMRWAGYRKVRRTLCRRLTRRLTELNVPDLARYRQRLATDPREWAVLDGLCPITISRFYRDKAMFDSLARVVLPSLATAAVASGARLVRSWSIGCASGEEPYTLALIWRLGLPAPAGCRLQLLGTDVGAEVLARAQRGCYPASSVSLLPPGWLAEAFTRNADKFCLRAEFRADVTFAQQDVRHTLPAGRFELILCRNLVFTYFDNAQQRLLLARILARLAPGGALVIGHRESLPAAVTGLSPWPGMKTLGIFRRTAVS